MMLEVRLLSATDLFLSGAESTGVQCAVSFGHLCSVETTTRQPTARKLLKTEGPSVSGCGCVDAVSGLKVPAPNVTVWNEALLLAVPLQVGAAAMKIVLWQSSTVTKEEAHRHNQQPAQEQQHGHVVEGDVIRECLGIIKVRVANIANKGFRTIDVHPRANKKERSAGAPGLGISLGTIRLSLKMMSSAPLFTSPTGGRSYMLLDDETCDVSGSLPPQNRINGTRDVAGAASSSSSTSIASVALPLMVPNTVFVCIVDLLSWRNPFRTLSALVISMLAVYWRLYDAALFLLLLASASVTMWRQSTLCRPAIGTEFGGANNNAEMFRSIRKEADRFRLYAPHCTIVNCLIRSMWWHSAGQDLLALQEMRNVVATAPSLASTFRIFLALAWILYLSVGCDEFFLTLLASIFIVVPLYLRSPTLVPKRNPDVLPCSIAAIVVVSIPGGGGDGGDGLLGNKPFSVSSSRASSQGALDTAEEEDLIARRSATRPPFPTVASTASIGVGSAIAVAGSASSNAGLVDSREPSQTRRPSVLLVNEHPPSLGGGSTHNRITPSLAANAALLGGLKSPTRPRRSSQISRHYGVISLDPRNRDDLHRLVEKIQILYEDYGVAGNFSGCTSCVCGALNLIRATVKHYSIYVSVPYEGSQDSLEEAGVALESLFQGSLFAGLNSGLENLYTVSSRVRPNWMVETGEGVDLVNGHSKYVVKLKPEDPSAHGVDRLLEAKAFTVLATYFLQARRLGMYLHPEATKLLLTFPLSAGSNNLLWNISSPCPPPLREAMDAVWNLEVGSAQSTAGDRGSALSGVSTQPPTPKSANFGASLTSTSQLPAEDTFTVDSVVAMLKSYESYWEAGGSATGSSAPKSESMTPLLYNNNSSAPSRGGGGGDAPLTQPVGGISGMGGLTQQSSDNFPPRESSRSQPHVFTASSTPNN